MYTYTFNNSFSVIYLLVLFYQVPQDAADLKKNIYYCRGCRNYLPSTDFTLTVNSRVMGLCFHCKELDGEARQREDFSHYKFILKRLCKDEAEYNPDSKIPYLLQVYWINHILEPPLSLLSLHITTGIQEEKYYVCVH